MANKLKYLNLDEDARTKIERLSAQTGRTQNSLIRAAIVTYVAMHSPEGAPPRQLTVHGEDTVRQITVL